MSPSDAHSSLAALRQLKEMLDAGTITPAEFETLKRQVIFGADPALPLDAVSGMPLAAPAPVVEAPLVAPAFETPEAPGPVPESTTSAYETEAPNPTELPLPSTSPDWLAAAAPSLLTSEEEADEVPIEERRNPLNLVFAIGGLLVFLGVIAYLMLGRPTTPDEHLTSGTQTAADSAAVVPEIGPQAEQITLPPVAPETVRVAPVERPATAPAASQFQSDSAVVPAAAAPASANKVSAAKAAVATPAPSPTVTDSAAKGQ